ncbi:MAG TPA: NAD(P)H-dependent oxidoreductase [Solirubrobacteraceae bacterium]|jgi:NAD(P)H dehydrogenase (quinone)|nr:NAD(P)H-dependent oxidoreductase [Solirubrobacteraceae bacterium]
MTRVALIHYSSTGNVHALAEALADGAEEAGAEVRLRRVAELAPQEAIEANPAWRAHADATAGIPEATHDDLRWADAFAFGTPARYGNVSAQLKQFLDTTAPLWAAGELADKPVTAFAEAGGNPYGTAHASGDGAPGPEVLAAASEQGRRLVRVAALLSSGVWPLAGDPR